MVKFLFGFVAAVSAAFSSPSVLEFWFEKEGVQSKWFASDRSFDREIEMQFGAQLQSFEEAEMVVAPEDAKEQLALVILLDQFSRNIYRKTPKAFAFDHLAVQVAQEGVKNGFDRQLTPVQRAFFYMPFEHAEDLKLQNQAVALFKALHEEYPENPSLKGFYEYAEKHRVMIERFGRFPHRNAILGRVSTEEEIAFLQQPGSGF